MYPQRCPEFPQFSSTIKKEWSMKITENIIDFMREDIETNFGYSRIIKKAKERLESEGKDFWEEFEKWKQEKNKKF
jgi:hypothetical protein